MLYCLGHSNTNMIFPMHILVRKSTTMLCMVLCSAFTIIQLASCLDTLPHNLVGLFFIFVLTFSRRCPRYCHLNICERESGNCHLGCSDDRLSGDKCEILNCAGDDTCFLGPGEMCCRHSSSSFFRNCYITSYRFAKFKQY